MISDALEYSDLYKALQATEKRLARPVNPTLMTSRAWNKKVAQGDSLAARIAAQSRMFLIRSADQLA